MKRGRSAQSRTLPFQTIDFRKTEASSKEILGKKMERFVL
jgi:hypothetical protein